MQKTHAEQNIPPLKANHDIEGEGHTGRDSFVGLFRLCDKRQGEIPTLALSPNAEYLIGVKNQEFNRNNKPHYYKGTISTHNQ